MTFSKKRSASLRSWLIRGTGLAVALSCTACAPKKQDGSDASNATFLIDPVTASSAEVVSVEQEWAFPNETLFTLQACLKDLGKLAPVINQNFVVHGGDRDQEVTTNSQGCLIWNENIEFNYLAPETFVPIERTIEAKGLHKGTQTLQLGIDPWRSGASSVIDLRYKPAPKIASVESSQSALQGTRFSAEGSAASRLTVNRLSVELTDETQVDDKVQMTLHLTMSPEVIRTRIDGEVREGLKGGNFDISATLVEVRPTQDNQFVREALATARARGSVDKGVINQDLPMTFVKMPSNQAGSRFELAFRVVPVSAPEGLAHEEGVVPLRSIKGGVAGDVRRDKQLFQLSPTTTTRIRAASETKACSTGIESFGFYFDDWKVSRGRVIDTTSNEGMPSQVALSTRVCLKSSIDQQPIINQPFQVTIEDGVAPQTLETDPKGCISWEDRISYDYYGRESFLPRKLTVQGLNRPYNGVTKSLPLYIDPWQTGDNFSWNCRSGMPPEFDRSQQASIAMTDFSYTFKGRDLELDQNLNLSLLRNYSFRLDPKIRRYDAFKGSNEYVSVLDGRYALKVLVLLPSTDSGRSGATNDIAANYKYLSSFEGEGQAVNGIIEKTVTLPFEFADLPVLNARSQIFIQITPLDSSSLKPMTLTAPFVAIDGKGGSALAQIDGASYSSKMEALEQDVSELIRVGTQARAQKQAAKIDLKTFKTSFGLKEVAAKKLAAVNLTPASIERLVKATRPSEIADAAKVCELFFDKSKSPQDAAACGASPKSKLELKAIRYVDNPQILSESADVVQFGINANFSKDVSSSLNVSSGKRISDGIKVGANVRAGWNFFGFLSAGVDTGYSHGWDWSYNEQTALNRSHGESIAFSQNKTLLSEELRVRFSAQTRRCLVVSGKSEVTKNNANGVLICSNKGATQETHQESWFYVSQTQGTTASPLRDINNPSDFGWIKVIRGTSAYLNFRQSLMDRTKVFILTRDESLKTGGNSLQGKFENYVRSHPEFNDSAYPSIVN